MPGKYLLTVAKVKVGSGSAKEVWVGMGRPQNLTPIQEKAIRKMSEPEYSFEIIDADKYASFSISLESNEFLYFELKPVDGVALGRGYCLMQDCVYFCAKMISPLAR